MSTNDTFSQEYKSEIFHNKSVNLLKYATEYSLQVKQNEPVSIFDHKNLSYLLDNILKLPEFYTMTKPSSVCSIDFIKAVKLLMLSSLEKLKNYHFYYTSEESYYTLEETLTLLEQTINVLSNLDRLPATYDIYKTKVNLIQRNKDDNETTVLSAFTELCTIEINKGIHKHFVAIKKAISDKFADANKLVYFLTLIKEFKRILEIDSVLFRNIIGDTIESLDTTKVYATIFWKELSKELYDFLEHFEAPSSCNTFYNNSSNNDISDNTNCDSNPNIEDDDLSRSSNESRNELNAKLWHILYDEFSNFYTVCSSFSNDLVKKDLKIVLEPILESFILDFERSTNKTFELILHKDPLVFISKNLKYSIGVIEIFKYLIPKLELIFKFPITLYNFKNIFSLYNNLVLEIYTKLKLQFKEMINLGNIEEHVKKTKCSILINNMIILYDKYKEAISYVNIGNCIKAINTVNIQENFETYLKQIDEIKDMRDNCLLECCCLFIKNLLIPDYETKVTEEYNRVKNDKSIKFDTDFFVEETGLLLSDYSHFFIYKMKLETVYLEHIYAEIMRIFTPLVLKSENHITSQKFRELYEMFKEINVLFEIYDTFESSKSKEEMGFDKLRCILVYFGYNDDGVFDELINLYTEENGYKEDPDVYPYV